MSHKRLERLELAIFFAFTIFLVVMVSYQTSQNGGKVSLGGSLRVVRDGDNACYFYRRTSLDAEEMQCVPAYPR